MIVNNNAIVDLVAQRAKEATVMVSNKVAGNTAIPWTQVLTDIYPE